MEFNQEYGLKLYEEASKFTKVGTKDISNKELIGIIDNYNNSLETLKNSNTKTMIENVFSKIPNEKTQNTIETAVLAEVREFQNNKSELLKKLDEMSKEKSKYSKEIKIAKSSLTKMKDEVKSVKEMLRSKGFVTEKTLCNIIWNKTKNTGMGGSLEKLYNLIKKARLNTSLLSALKKEEQEFINSEKGFQNSYKKLEKLNDTSQEFTSIELKDLSKLRTSAETKAKKFFELIMKESKNLAKKSCDIIKESNKIADDIKKEIESQNFDNDIFKAFFSIMIVNNLINSISDINSVTGNGGGAFLIFGAAGLVIFVIVAIVLIKLLL